MSEVFICDFSRMEPQEKTAWRELARLTKREEVAEATGQGNVEHRALCVRRAKRKLRYLRAEARVEPRIHSSSRRESKPRSQRRRHGSTARSSSSDDPGEPEPAEGLPDLTSFAGTDPLAEEQQRAGAVRGQQAASGSARFGGAVR